MAESYESIISRLSGAPVEVDKKPANDFATYVRTLLDNTSPRGNMFARQDEIDRINQANLAEELEKKKVEEELLKLEAAEAAGLIKLGESDGGFDGGGVNASAPTGSLSGQNAALNALAIAEPLSNFSTYAAIAKFGLQAYLDNQLDAINDSFNTLSNNTPYGMFSVSDANANTSFQSTPASIGAADYGLFGVVSDGRGGFLGDIGGGSTIGNSGMGVNSAGQTVSNNATIAAQNAAIFGSPNPFGRGASGAAVGGGGGVTDSAGNAVTDSSNNAVSSGVY